MIMDEYAAWDPAERNHAYGVFPTSILRQVEEFIAPMSIENSAETGCGKSTILLSNYSQKHTIFTQDDRHLGEQSSMNFFLNCPLTKTDRLSYVLGPTQRTLPEYKKHQRYDLALIDGPHGYPYPEMEYYHLYPYIKPNGVLILDDLEIPTIARLADFIAEDDMFEVAALISVTAIFRRTDAPLFDPTGDGWWTQKYNRRRVSRRRDIFLPAQSVVDRFSSLQLDKVILGD
jgi:hypothetical protein